MSTESAAGQEQLSRIEGLAAGIMPDLLGFRKLDVQAKTDFAYFLATMFARSPAQLRQIAAHYAATAHWAGSHELEFENRQKMKDGLLTDDDLKVQDFLLDRNNYAIDVDRRVGLLAFKQCETLAKLMVQMTWTFELSENQELLTSENCVIWVNGGPERVTGPYGFGLGHRQAVIPFPLSPKVILRLDWLPGAGWSKHRLDKKRARLANQYQAKHKNRFLYYRTRDEGFRILGMKYAEPVNQLDSGVNAPEIFVVRKLKGQPYR